MTKTFKEQIIITDFKKGKILKKEITKKILTCFNQTPKTASEIANSISFPKEKIYYHIKNLIANDILYIESKEIVKGIEQKRFFPTAKSFKTPDQSVHIETKGSDPQTLVLDTNPHKPREQILIQNEETKLTRNTHERRRNSDRRIIQRRDKNTNRRNGKQKFTGKEKRLKVDRRNSNERRLLHKRRELIDRRIHKKHFYNHNDKNVKAEKLHLKKPRSLTYKNSLLQLNGIKEAMTFVQSGNHVTFLYCTLKIQGFQINQSNHS